MIKFQVCHALAKVGKNHLCMFFNLFLGLFWGEQIFAIAGSDNFFLSKLIFPTFPSKTSSISYHFITKCVAVGSGSQCCLDVVDGALDTLEIKPCGLGSRIRDVCSPKSGPKYQGPPTVVRYMFVWSCSSS